MKKKPKNNPSKKAEGIKNDIRKGVFRLLNEPSVWPEKKLFQALSLPASFKSFFTSVMKELVEKKEIAKTKNGYQKTAAKKQQVITGVLQLHNRGFGFVVPDKEFEGEDVFIPKHLTNSAVDGDLVEVEVSSVVSPKGPEGRILNILKRGRTHLAGIVIDGKNGKYSIFSPLLGKQKKVILTTTEELKAGDRVIAKVTNWNSDRKETECTLKSHIGSISDPSVDVAAAVEEFEIVHAFSSEALKEAASFGTEIPEDDLDKRKDLTKITTITIDPVTAKDFDDAISLSRDKKGNFLLGVHIADAANYVKPGSALDKDAYLRSNSTYFPGKCVPMLPENLSNGLCSLKPEVVRLTISVFLSFDKEGTLTDSKIEKSYIKSQKRFTYGEAYEVLQKKIKSPHLKLLQDCEELCLLLKKKRMERGSIDFSLSDAVIQVDEMGMPQGVKIEHYDITHQLIEEFMLKANEIVAQTLAKRGKTLIYRIHEEPSKENFQEFFAFARLLGYAMPSEPKHTDIQNLFLKAKDTPQFPRLSVAFIRSMKLAFYSPENVGHYGLALEHYTHFTSPIRRYSDLVIQRLLFDEQPPEQDLNEIANNCSQRERVSMRAENSVVNLKKLRLLQKYYSEDPNRIYEAQITRVKPFGIFFEMADLSLEGSIHVSELGNDFFHFNQQSQSFRGEKTNKTYSLSDLIFVRLSSIDFVYQEAKFSLTKRK